MRRARYLAILLCAVTAVFNTVPFSHAGAAAVDGMLRTKGNKIVDSNGQEVRLFGLNCPSLEWTPAGDNMPDAVITAFDQWESNLVRLPMNQDFWFGHHSSQTDGGAAYRELISDIVKIAEERKKYIWLDLHWSNAGTEWGMYTGQHKMPDLNSLVFWESVAKEYKNHPYVLFGLYNEPYSISWDVWKNGGQVVESVEVTENYKTVKKTLKYEAVGMQTLIDAIRAQGANNLIIAGGLDWGFDLSNAANEKYRLVDTPEGSGIVLDTHPYPWKSKNWSFYIDKAGEHYPIIVGEFGVGPSKKDPGKPDESNFKDYHETLFNWIEKNNYSYTAWSFHPSAGPCIIRSWSYEPTPFHGVFVRDFLIKTAARGVSLFEGANYTGRSADIKPGEYTEADLRAAGIDPASIRSLKLNNDRRLSYKLTLFSEDDFGGSIRSYIFNIPDLQALPGFEAVRSLKLETVSLENLNKGSSVESSSNNEDSSAVTDGDEKTRWIVIEEGPKWVKTDMGSVHTIHRIIIKHASSHRDTRHNNNQDFKVSISSDGTDWTEVASVTGNMDYASIIDFEPAAARYVKVDIIKGSRIPPHTRVTISEIEVYGIKNPPAGDGSVVPENLAQENGIDSNKGKSSGTGTGKDSSPGGSVGRNSWLWLAFTSLISVIVIAITVLLRRRKGNS
jgi:hypothetical protein